LKRAHGLEAQELDRCLNGLLVFYSCLHWYLKWALGGVLPLAAAASAFIDNDSERKYAVPVLGMGFRYMDSLVVYLRNERDV